MQNCIIIFSIIFLCSGLVAKEIDYSTAVKTGLKLNLVGTIVYSDNKKSIASVNRGAYRVTENISGKALVIKISRLKVFIKNLKNNSIEYITTGKYIKSKAVNNSNIFKNKKNKYHIDRRLIDKVTSNLSSFLQDAGTRFVKDKKGNVVGAEITYIKKGGIFESLGVEVGDVISDVNSLPLNSIGSALKIFNQFKNSSEINLNIKRNGKAKRIKYLVR